VFFYVASLLPDTYLVSVLNARQSCLLPVALLLFLLLVNLLFNLFHKSASETASAAAAAVGNITVSVPMFHKRFQNEQTRHTILNVCLLLLMMLLTLLRHLLVRQICSCVQNPEGQARSYNQLH
jgi:hypothetical protein